MSTVIESAPSIERSPSRTARGVPPLENGDRLTRTEFYRRWEATPNLKKAERIEGVVYMAAAVRLGYHAGPHLDFGTLLGNYKKATPGIAGGLDGTIRVDDENDPQPDAFLLILPECGGQTEFEDAYVVGTPEWIGEIAASSAGIDLNQKLEVYRRNGVQEYVVWKVLEEQIVWFHWQDGKFVEKSPDEDGIFRSEILPGLWLDAESLIHGDLDKVHDVLEQGLKSNAHSEFVDRLASQRDSSHG